MSLNSNITRSMDGVVPPYARQMQPVSSESGFLGSSSAIPVATGPAPSARPVPVAPSPAPVPAKPLQASNTKVKAPQSQHVEKPRAPWLAIASAVVVAAALAAVSVALYKNN